MRELDVVTSFIQPRLQLSSLPPTPRIPWLTITTADRRGLGILVTLGPGIMSQTQIIAAAAIMYPSLAPTPPLPDDETMRAATIADHPRAPAECLLLAVNQVGNFSTRCRQLPLRH